MANDRTVNAFFSLRVPAGLVDAVVGLQDRCSAHVDPQQREHMHAPSLDLQHEMSVTDFRILVRRELA